MYTCGYHATVLPKKIINHAKASLFSIDKCPVTNKMLKYVANFPPSLPELGFLTDYTSSQNSDSSNGNIFFKGRSCSIILAGAESDLTQSCSRESHYVYAALINTAVRQ